MPVGLVPLFHSLVVQPWPRLVAAAHPCHYARNRVAHGVRSGGCRGERAGKLYVILPVGLVLILVGHLGSPSFRHSIPSWQS